MLWILMLTGCQKCDIGEACRVDDGRYFVMSPTGWDGEQPLPMLLHAHGWGGSPEVYLDRADIQATLDTHQILLVLPEGKDATWSIDHMGLVGNGRSEVAFIDDVLADAQSRWPIDDSRIYVSGFSLGASLVYTLACERGDVFAAAAPVSGGFWMPLPESCSAPTIPICHIHGNNDPTWPIEGGRVLALGPEEGTHASVEDDVAFWRTHNACTETAIERTADVLTCTTWSECEDDVFVELCTHGGGHEQFENFLEREVEWMMQYSR
ncbi:MAG: polyhydroxybutyrate depolymerase [Myxococcota bacterium]|jgi:polyhydroxybutyrate depolymerase